jgi:hypothetical protein
LKTGVVWDASGGLEGGKTVRVWINGSNELSMSDTIDTTHLSATIMNGRHGGSFMNTDDLGFAWMDNLKIWNDVASEDPSWTVGVPEEALHPIYGPANGYTPKLTGPGNGVGYYYVP